MAKSDLGALAVGVASPSLARNYDLDSVHDARLLVEQRVVARAAGLISPQQIAQLHKSLSAQDECHDDPVRFLLCDREFHSLIYRACDNGLLADIAMDLYNYQLEHRRRIVARSGSIIASIADHRAIVAALESRKPEAAEPHLPDMKCASTARRRNFLRPEWVSGKGDRSATAVRFNILMNGDRLKTYCAILP